MLKRKKNQFPMTLIPSREKYQDNPGSSLGLPGLELLYTNNFFGNSNSADLFLTCSAPLLQKTNDLLHALQNFSFPYLCYCSLFCVWPNSFCLAAVFMPWWHASYLVGRSDIQCPSYIPVCISSEKIKKYE